MCNRLLSRLKKTFKTKNLGLEPFCLPLVISSAPFASSPLPLRLSPSRQLLLLSPAPSSQVVASHSSLLACRWLCESVLVASGQHQPPKLRHDSPAALLLRHQCHAALELCRQQDTRSGPCPVRRLSYSVASSWPVRHLSSSSFVAGQQELGLQFNSQSSSISPQIGLGIGVQGAGVASISSVSQQLPSSVLQHSSQHNLIPIGLKDNDAGRSKVEELTQVNLSDSLNVERPISPSFNKIISNDDFRTTYMTTDPVSLSDGSKWPRDTELSPGLPLQLGQSSANVGVIGRRSAVDFGVIGDNHSGSAGTSTVLQDQIFNMKLLEAAYHRLPHPSDSQPSNYVPRYPAVTPASYPQTQAPIIDNPAFWERLGIDAIGIDTLFFAFYYHPNTYQQYLAARELKKQSWRYHKKFNTWFQRHEEPKFSHDTFERGNYIYFDFHLADDGSQNGWCQRIKTDFTFEYGFLEDELVV